MDNYIKSLVIFIIYLSNRAKYCYQTVSKSIFGPWYFSTFSTPRISPVRTRPSVPNIKRSAFTLHNPAIWLNALSSPRNSVRKRMALKMPTSMNLKISNLSRREIPSIWYQRCSSLKDRHNIADFKRENRLKTMIPSNKVCRVNKNNSTNAIFRCRMTQLNHKALWIHAT